MAVSPSGSVHRITIIPGNGIKIWNSDSEFALGVDVRGDGGMVIAPPSIKPNVGIYKWINEGHAIADAPAWLIGAARISAAERRAKADGQEAGPKIISNALPTPTRPIAIWKLILA